MRSASQSMSWCAGYTVALLAATVGCGGEVDAPLATVGQSVSAHDARTIDDDMEDIADHAPGFGGAYLEDDGSVVLQLVDSGLKAAAEQALTSLHPEHAKARFVTREARYGFRDLTRWRNLLRQAVFSGPVTLDADERANRVRIGVSVSADEMDAALLAYGIPPEAVVIESYRPVRLLWNETQNLRNTKVELGGVQVTAYRADGSYVMTCTFGAWLSQVGSSRNVGITSSHCSDVPGSWDGGMYFVPANPYTGKSPCTDNYVGTKVADPPYFTGGVCPANKVCRYSDAMTFAPPTWYCPPLWHSAIVCPSQYASCPIVNGLNFAPPGPDIRLFNLASKSSSVLLGTTLAKVGRTTGYSSGTLDSTCVDYDFVGTNRRLICQNTVTGTGMQADGGDSGAVVFYDPSPSVAGTFVGLLWGQVLGTYSMYICSPVSGIERELGALSIGL